jgi:phage baseplate assembly protein W
MSKYKDLNLDLSTNSFTKDIAVTTDNRSITQSLTNIILTKVGERPFSSSNVGVGVQSLFYTMSNVRSPEILDLKQTTKEKINRYEPRVVFNDMEIINDDYIESGKITLNISYTIKASNSSDSLRLVIGEN